MSMFPDSLFYVTRPCASISSNKTMYRIKSRAAISLPFNLHCKSNSCRVHYSVSSSYLRTLPSLLCQLIASEGFPCIDWLDHPLLSHIKYLSMARCIHIEAIKQRLHSVYPETFLAQMYHHLHKSANFKVDITKSEWKRELYRYIIYEYWIWWKILCT